MARAFSVVLTLLVYVLPTVVLPAVHAADELIEIRSCPACEEPPLPAIDGPSVGAECTVTGCSNPSHRHHNHPLHDSLHCTLCLTAGAVVVVDRPAPGVELPLMEAVAAALLPGSTELPPRATRRLEVARGPPAA
jgi:hypothetical protein